MVKGRGYITSQCCGSTEIELGTVYAADGKVVYEQKTAEPAGIGEIPDVRRLFFVVSH